MSTVFNPSRLVALVAVLVVGVALLGCQDQKKPTGPEKPKAGPGVEEPAPEEPAPEEPTPEEPTPEEPTPEEPTPEEPTPEEPMPEEPTPEEPTPEEPTPEEPAPEEPAPEEPAPEEPAAAEGPEPLSQAELLVTFPEKYNSPDGMCLMDDGSILVSVPNINDREDPPAIVKVTPDNEIEPFFDPPPHPDTGEAYPFGINLGPNGDVYYADLQWFADPENPNYKSRVVRIPMEDGKPGEPEVVVEGMVVANAVIIRDGHLYVSDTTMVPGSKPLVSGVYRIGLDEERPVKLKRPLEEEPHLIATVLTHNAEVAFGADGLTFDSKGNMYIGNFADGTVHKVEFDEEGNPKNARPSPVWAKAPFMKSCDGIFCDLKTDKIYVADSLANAVQIVDTDGTVTLLARDPEGDGTDGRLDQPSEVVKRGNKIIAANFDFPVPGGVNTKYETPNTLCVIPLD